MPIAEVLRADEGFADVGVVDRDRVFSYEIKIYDTNGNKIAELASHIGKITVNNITFGYLRNGGCADFSFTLSEEYTKATISYNYGVKICLYSQPNPWFTGFITKLPEKGTDKVQDYSGFGYVKQLSWIRVNEIKTAEEVASIVESILDDYIIAVDYPYDYQYDYITPLRTDIQKNRDKLDSPIYPMVSTIYFERVAALEVFQRLQQLAGDYEFGVDEERDFYFRRIDTDVLEKFWIGKHLTTFKASEDQEPIRNRLYVKGGRLRNGSDYIFYVEDITSQNTYGLREDVVTASEFWSTDSFTNLASGVVPVTNLPDVLAHPPAHATDGNIATYWDSGAPQAIGHYIQIDLGATFDRISRIILDSSDDAIRDQFARGFEIRIVAENGEQTVVFESTALSTSNPDIKFTPVQGRWVIITLTTPDTENWRLGEIGIYELDTFDIERWANYLLVEKKDIRKKATLTIEGVDKLISQKATITPYKPTGKWGIYDEDGAHIEDYYVLAVKYNLTPQNFSMSAELGQLEGESIPAFFKKTLQRLEEYNMSGVRKIDDLSGATGAKPLGITRTIIGPDVIEVPHLKGNKISLHGGLVELGRGVMSAGGHGFAVSDGTYIRFEAGKLNGDYGTIVRDVSGNVTVDLGKLAGESDKKGLIVKMNVANPTHQIDVDADHLKLDDATQLLANIDLTIDIEDAGANGLDAGAEANDTWYSIWVIHNPTTDTVAGLLSTSTDAPTMPAGYTRKRRVGWVRNDAGGDFLKFYHFGDWFYFDVRATLLATLAAANIWTELDCGPHVPPGTELMECRVATVDNDSDRSVTQIRRKGMVGAESIIHVEIQTDGTTYAAYQSEALLTCDTARKIEYQNIAGDEGAYIYIYSYYDPI